MHYFPFSFLPPLSIYIQGDIVRWLDMRKVLILLIMVVVFSSLHSEFNSEELHFGVNLGFNRSSLGGEPNYRYYYNNHYYYYYDYYDYYHYHDYYHHHYLYYDERYFRRFRNEVESISGLQGGISVMILNDRFPALPELGLRFNQRGYSYFIQEHTLNYLDLYVLFKYNMPQSLFSTPDEVKAYPYIGFAESYLLWSSSTFYVEKRDADGWFRSTDFSMLLGMEVITLDKLSVKMEFMWGMNEIFTPKAHLDRHNRRRRAAYNESFGVNVGWIF